MSKYFIIYLVISAILGLIGFVFKYWQNKQFKARLQYIERTVTHNANVCNEKFMRTDSIVLLLLQKDPLFADKIAYLEKRIAAHKKNPKHYPFNPEEWIAAFELAHLKIEE